jgi:hypothetical protein
MMDNTESTWDRLLTKYSLIWIWSVILGLNSGLTYSFYTFRVSNFGSLTLILICFYILAFLFSLITWLRLLGVLKNIILPSLFQKTGNMDSIFDSKPAQLAKYYLSSSLYYLVIAFVFKFLAFIIDLIMNSFTKINM